MDRAAGQHHCFTSFFMSKLLEDTGSYNYENARKHSSKLDLFSFNKIFFPINIGSTHWTLVVVDVPSKIIQYYDSMGGIGAKYVDGIVR